MAGVRIAMVSNISLVTVGVLVGVRSLGELFTDGFQRNFGTPLVVGIGLVVLLALIADTLLVLVQRVLTPWMRGRGRARSRRMRVQPVGEPA
jgi:osmoprotectant transport system permease protein